MLHVQRLTISPVIPRQVLYCVMVVLSTTPAWAQTCGTAGQLCVNNAACNDGDPCNGTETCFPPLDMFRFCRCDSTPPCDDNNPCTRDTCTETPHRLDCDHFAGGCSDGVYCNGLETCALPHLITCQAGTPPCAAPLFCDEAGDRCVECLSVADCEEDYLICTANSCNDGQCVYPWCDDLFCPGREGCNIFSGCQPFPPVCDNAALCNEAARTCGDCDSDADCADGDDCTVEACDANWKTCRTEPCTLAIESPGDQTVFAVSELVDVVGVGPRGLDVALVFQEWSEILPQDYSLLRNFGKQLVNGLPEFRPDDTGTKAGVSAFSSGSYRKLSLNNNRQMVLDSIQDIGGFGSLTCIGCGIDSGASNINTNGRLGATKLIFLVIADYNNLPPVTQIAHLMGSLDLAKFRRQVIFAIGVDEYVNLAYVQQIATPLPNRQTAFYERYYSSLGSLVSTILNQISPLNVNTVDITLPDGGRPVTLVDPTGHWSIQDWAMLPGENVFTAHIETLFGPKTETLTLIGKYPCQAACGDVNGDFAIDLRDVAVFQRCFGHAQYVDEECACTDLNGDIAINFDDWSALLSAWDSPTENHPPNCVIP